MSDSIELPAGMEMALARYRAGEMSADERATFEHDVLANETLAEALYREVALDALHPTAVARPALPSAVPFRPRLLRHMMLPVAAALMVVLSLFFWSERPRVVAPGPETMRGGGGALALIEPAGALAGPVRVFRWTHDPGAASYRIDLYDRLARRVATAVTTDTLLLAEALSRQPVTAGQWRVVALGADGMERPARARATFEQAR